ncbi:unnamed protein product [Rotaria magnacalcarata]|nr:unnamed protein product [Rotaria magnacalcarata]CAF4089229.1 unnamed protein product [Rotaria magnacalcarata]
MERSTPDRLLGISIFYYRPQGFYFIKLPDDFQFTLAYRAGIKNYDRIISWNGSSLEEDTHWQFLERFDSERNLTVTLLVCSPATYQHYKSTNRNLLRDSLPNIKRLRPIQDIEDLQNSGESLQHVATTEQYAPIFVDNAPIRNNLHNMLDNHVEPMIDFDRTQRADENSMEVSEFMSQYNVETEGLSMISAVEQAILPTYPR